MEILVPKYRRNPNEKIDSLYFGVAPGGVTVTTINRVAPDGNRLVKERVFGAGLTRGQGGRIGIMVLGGLETTLDEMEDILETKKRKAFVPKRKPADIAEMCRMVMERRNEAIRQARRLPRPARRRTLYLPVGCRMVPTSIPGLKILAGA